MKHVSVSTNEIDEIDEIMGSPKFQTYFNITMLQHL
jgi:hypothetical protein